MTATMLVALTAASGGAIPLAVVLLMPALGFGLYARHWLSLAERSHVGARSLLPDPNRFDWPGAQRPPRGQRQG